MNPHAHNTGLALDLILDQVRADLAWFELATRATPYNHTVTAAWEAYFKALKIRGDLRRTLGEIAREIGLDETGALGENQLLGRVFEVPTIPTDDLVRIATTALAAADYRGALSGDGTYARALVALGHRVLAAAGELPEPAAAHWQQLTDKVAVPLSAPPVHVTVETAIGELGTACYRLLAHLMSRYVDAERSFHYATRAPLAAPEQARLSSDLARKVREVLATAHVV